MNLLLNWYDKRINKLDKNKFNFLCNAKNIGYFTDIICYKTIIIIIIIIIILLLLYYIFLH